MMSVRGIALVRRPDHGWQIIRECGSKVEMSPLSKVEMSPSQRARSAYRPRIPMIVQVLCAHRGARRGLLPTVWRVPARERLESAGANRHSPGLILPDETGHFYFAEMGDISTLPRHRSFARREAYQKCDRISPCLRSTLSKRYPIEADSPRSAGRLRNSRQPPKQATHSGLTRLTGGTFASGARPISSRPCQPCPKR
jgi:hypothetical protein